MVWQLFYVAGGITTVLFWSLVCIAAGYQIGFGRGHNKAMEKALAHVSSPLHAAATLLNQVIPAGAMEAINDTISGAIGGPSGARRRRDPRADEGREDPFLEEGQRNLAASRSGQGGRDDQGHAGVGSGEGAAETERPETA